MTSTAPMKPLREKTRVARFFLPNVAEDSCLLPPDRWIIKNVIDIVRTNKDVKKSLTRTAGFAALTLAAAGIGLTALTMLAAMPFLAAGVSTIAAVAFLGTKTQRCCKFLKENTLPAIGKDMGARYLKLKGSELVEEWKNRAARKSSKKIKEKKPAPEKIKASLAETPVTANDAVKTPADKKPAPPSESTKLANKLSNWMLKKAMQKAQGAKETKDIVPPPAAPPSPSAPPAP